MINFIYLDSAYIELSSDTSFIPKLSSLESKTQSQRQRRQKNAGPIYEVYRYLISNVNYLQFPCKKEIFFSHSIALIVAKGLHWNSMFKRHYKQYTMCCSNQIETRLIPDLPIQWSGTERSVPIRIYILFQKAGSDLEWRGNFWGKKSAQFQFV